MRSLSFAIVVQLLTLNMRSLVTTFCTTVDHYARGTQSFERLIQENRSIFRTFKTTIRSTAPNFVPYIRKEGIPSTFQNYIGDGEDEGPGEGLISKDSYFYLDDMTRHINKYVIFRCGLDRQTRSLTISRR